MKDKTFEYFNYEVGRENYKPTTNKLVWYVITNDNGKIYPKNLFEYNWVFLEDGLIVAKEMYYDNYKKFSSHVRDWLQHEYWARSQYEVIVKEWVGMPCEYKLDVYTQVMLNWDRFIEYVWNNRHLITRKKLGLSKK